MNPISLYSPPVQNMSSESNASPPKPKLLVRGTKVLVVYERGEPWYSGYVSAVTEDGAFAQIRTSSIWGEARWHRVALLKPVRDE